MIHSHPLAFDSVLNQKTSATHALSITQQLQVSCTTASDGFLRSNNNLIRRKYLIHLFLFPINFFNCLWHRTKHTCRFGEYGAVRTRRAREPSNP